MAAYMIADIEVTDPKLYDDYRRQVAPTVAKFGGRFLVRGGEHAVLEGSWDPKRLIVVEFPDMATLTAWYQSAEYAPLIALRQRASNSRLVSVEGS